MNLNELREMFGIKIYLEYEMYKKEMLKQSPEEIFDKAYEIDCYVTMYEYLLEMSQKLKKEEIESILFFPRFLAFLYGEWLGRSDVTQEEMYVYIYEEIQKQMQEFIQEVA